MKCGECQAWWHLKGKPAESVCDFAPVREGKFEIRLADRECDLTKEEIEKALFRYSNIESRYAEQARNARECQDFLRRLTPGA